MKILTVIALAIIVTVIFGAILALVDSDDWYDDDDFDYSVWEERENK